MSRDDAAVEDIVRAAGLASALREALAKEAFLADPKTQSAVLEAMQRSGRQLSPAEVSRFWFREGLRFARQHLETDSLQAR